MQRTPLPKKILIIFDSLFYFFNYLVYSCFFWPKTVLFWYTVVCFDPGPDRLQVMAANAFKMSTDSMLIRTIRTDLEADEFAQDVLNHIIPDRASCSRSVNSRNSYNQFSWHDNSLFRNNLLYRLDSLFYNTAMTCQWLDILEFIKLWN